MKIVEKRTHFQENIAEAIVRRVETFARQHGKYPGSIILGANEYLSLCHKYMEALHEQHGGVPGVLYPTEFNGIPVRIKTGSGIDLEILPSMASHFAIGVMHANDVPET